MTNSHTEKLTRLAQRAGILRSRDLDAQGIPRQYLRILEDRGILRRTGRGLYVHDKATPTEGHTVAQAAKLVPQGIVCLLTALRLHGLTAQAPFEVWTAIRTKAWKPRIDYPPLRIVRFSDAAFAYGIEQRKIDGVTVRLFTAAKTVADCFKYRNKIGLDVALEALRDSVRKRKATMDQLWRAAEVCRMANVMRPYMESIA